MTAEAPPPIDSNLNTPVVPSAASVAFASKLIRELDTDSARFVLQDRDSVTSIEIDETVYDLILQLLITIANNRAVSLIPYDHELTTHQAADFLNVSRGYVIKLLDSGQLGHRMVGTHRRVRLEEVLAYRERMQRTASDSLDEIARIDQTLGLAD